MLAQPLKQPENGGKSQARLAPLQSNSAAISSTGTENTDFQPGKGHLQTALIIARLVHVFLTPVKSACRIHHLQ